MIVPPAEEPIVGMILVTSKREENCAEGVAMLCPWLGTQTEGNVSVIAGGTGAARCNQQVASVALCDCTLHLRLPK